MFSIKNLLDNDNIKIVDKKGDISVLEYQLDYSVSPQNSMQAYFSSKMNVRKRQALIQLHDNEYVTSAGAMQWTVGNVQAVADVKGVGDFLGKAIKGSVTKESAVKPKYKGNGVLVLEPTYRYIILEDLENWAGGIVLDDGLFLACDAKIKQTIAMRSNLSSAVLGNEGLFNLKLTGNGIAVLESPVPREELIEIELKNDEIRVDGNFAIAWSDTLDFRVEKSTKSLIGSAVAGEGFVNVYRGTGKVLLSPVSTSAMAQRSLSMK